MLAGCGANGSSNNSGFTVGQPQVAGGNVVGTGGVGTPTTSTGTGTTGTLGAAGTASTGITGTMGTGGMGAPMPTGTGGMTAMGTGGVGTGGMGTGGMAMMGTGGMTMMGTAGMTGGACGSGTPTDGRPTTGPLACILEQHNAVRAMVKTSTPLPPLTWNADIATYAQQWADMVCTSPHHRTSPSLNGQRLGENLFAGFGTFTNSTPGKEAIDGWAAEVACWTPGPFMSGDKCDMTCTSNMNSDGCGHYTQVVWRATTQLGCGVSMCGSGFAQQVVVICNYAPAGNFIGMNVY